MSAAANIIIAGNKIFPKVVHPFNLANDGVKTYGEWQYEKGADTIACYSERFAPEEMFGGKYVLDMGCGAAGKSIYYASLGADKVVGNDILPQYEREAMNLAKKFGCSSRFNFVCASASELPYPDNTFDTIIMNDFMEHTSDPEGALTEAVRLIKKGGLIFINFPPYYHPTGAHMSDVINMPWVQLFFSEKSIIEAYYRLTEGLPDRAERLKFRFSTAPDGHEYISYINKMTLRRFKKMLKSFDIKPMYYNEIPLRKFLTPLARFPLTKEMFVKMAVCVISK